MKKLLLLLIVLLSMVSLNAQTIFYWRNDQNAPLNASWSNSNPVYFWNGSAGQVPPGAEIIQFEGNSCAVSVNDLAATNRFKINFYTGSGTISRTLNGTTNNVFYDFGGASPLIQNWSGMLQTINFPFQIGNESSNSTSPNYAYGMHIWAGGGDLNIGSAISAANATGGFSKELVLTAGASQTLTMSGVISDGNGTIKLSKWGAGNLLISASNTYTGNTNINDGAVWIESGGNITVSNIYLGNAASTVAKLYLSKSSGGTTFARPININSGNSGTRIIGALNTSGTNTFSGNIVRSSTQPLTVDVPNAGGSLTISGTINGSGEFRKIGSGTVTISGTNNGTSPNNFTGSAWNVEQGTMSFNFFGTNLNAKPVILGNATDLGTVIYTGTGGAQTVPVSTNAGGGKLICSTTGHLSMTPTPNTQTIAGTFDIACNSTYNVTVAYIMTGAGGFKCSSTNTGILYLTRANTYSGTTTLNSGILTLGVANAIPSGATGVQSAVTFNGGTLSTGAASAGFSCGTSTYPMGALTVGASGGTIALAATSASQTLYFANSSGATWGGGTLNITGWTGSAGSTGTNGKIFIGSDATALTSAQLAKISFAGFTAGAQILPTGEIVPIQTSISSTTSASTLGLSASTSLTIASAGTLTIDNNSSVNAITLSPGAKLTLNSGQTLTASTGITLQSDATGTATFVDNNTSSPQAITGIVQQYLPQGRNWYMSSPVAGANASTLTATGTGSSVTYYNETSSSFVTDYTGTLTPGKGYIAVSSSGTATNNVQFSGTLNTGVITVPLTRLGSTKAGFNLVANPYPCYLDWSLVDTTSAKIMTTVWYRTKTAGNTYTFDTYNAKLNLATANGTRLITNLIPPMQAFWVRVNAGQTGGTLTFTNSMRKHIDNSSNQFKIQAQKNTDTKVLRLRVSNGLTSDETVLCFNPNATDNFDGYDSQKMFNSNTSVPEIFTQVGLEQVVINGMKELKFETEIPLGFATGEANSFSLSNTEMINFDAGTQLILKDKLLNIETDLSNGSSYTFSSATTTPTTTRFSLIFRSVGVTTDAASKPMLNSQVFVYNNKIKIVSSENAAYMAVNSIGQKVCQGETSSTVTLLSSIQDPGIYLVTVIEKGQIHTTRIILK